MVLRDTALPDMTYDDMARVLRPKVDGSVNLDRLFHNQSLEFFVFLSSMASVVGNPGQANYTAANLFMCGLAQQRRQRGLAASVVDLGIIVSIGYISREVNTTAVSHMISRGFSRMSESGVHQSFAEAIASGRPDSGAEPEIITGLRKLPASLPNRPHWYTYPQWGCMTVKDIEGDPSTTTRKVAVSIRDKLGDARTLDEVYRVITGKIKPPSS